MNQRVEDHRNDVSKKRTLVVAEDDRVTATVICKQLEKEGYRVIHSPDGQQALNALLANDVDLAVLDVNMPIMDGFTTLKHIRADQNHAHMPVIMLTGMSMDQDIQRARQQGASGYMTKPFAPGELVKKIGQLLADQLDHLQQPLPEKQS